MIDCSPNEFKNTRHNETLNFKNDSTHNQMLSWSLEFLVGENICAFSKSLHPFHLVEAVSRNSQHLLPTIASSLCNIGYMMTKFYA